LVFFFNIKQLFANSSVINYVILQTMDFFNSIDTDYIIILGLTYLFVAATVAKLGSAREVGGRKTLLYSLLFTPVYGLYYVYHSPAKDTLKIVHYRCPKCGLEHTEGHRYCPNCKKEGEKIRLKKFYMRTY